MATFVDKLGLFIIFLLCDPAVADKDEVSLMADVPYLSAQLYNNVDLECCFNTSKRVMYNWVKQIYINTSYEEIIVTQSTEADLSKQPVCGKLSFSVNLTHSGFYRCVLKGIKHDMRTHGTYLQVYKPLEKTINISENAKNQILTAEGILLLCCVLLPSATLLLKSKRNNSLEKKKAKKEEENIYQGLNLDDCSTTYDQIERSQAQDPYQDVCNFIEEEEDIQLEKP